MPGRAPAHQHHYPRGAGPTRAVHAHPPRKFGSSPGPCSPGPAGTGSRGRLRSASRRCGSCVNNVGGLFGVAGDRAALALHGACAAGCGSGPLGAGVPARAAAPAQPPAAAAWRRSPRLDLGVWVAAAAGGEGRRERQPPLSTSLACMQAPRSPCLGPHCLCSRARAHMWGSMNCCSPVVLSCIHGRKGEQQTPTAVPASRVAVVGATLPRWSAEQRGRGGQEHLLPLARVCRHRERRRPRLCPLPGHNCPCRPAAPAAQARSLSTSSSCARVTLVLTNCTSLLSRLQSMCGTVPRASEMQAHSCRLRRYVSVRMPSRAAR